MIVATGIAATANVAVVVVVQPFAPFVVYETVAVPGVDPTPDPVEPFTFTTEVFELDHVPPETGFVKFTGLPAQTADGPLIGAFAGTGNTVTKIGVEVAEQPLEAVADIVYDCVVVGLATGFRTFVADNPVAGDQTGVIEGQPEAVPFQVPEEYG